MTTQDLNYNKATDGKMKRIAVNGRRWFDKANGNTYCSASILINGADGPTVEPQYGYGDYYVQAAGEAMEAAGLTPDRKDNEPLWSWCDRHGIEFRYSAQDVTREGAL